MLDDIFHSEELPNFKVYEVAHDVVSLYMKKRNCKIDLVAAELDTTKNVLYRQLNPKDMTMPLSIDRIMAITKLTGDNRILEEIAREFDLVLIPKKEAHSTCRDINILADMSSIEQGDVFKEVKQALADGSISKVEKEHILKEIDESQVATAKLRDGVLSLVVSDEE